MQTVKTKNKNHRRVKGYASQLLNLLNNNLCNHFQSANRADHSAEKALLDVLNCLLGSADEGQESVLTVTRFTSCIPCFGS